ncbi:BNR repeat domain protein [Labilithrix luteola]|uniref:BNR repeat domain protein n=1 Tax=Labilithrix luteola TaxID=1391654 RepID=A0A0K1QDP1_9BACT|nr:BNR repeat domain protein [Labilithrix luteola]
MTPNGFEANVKQMVVGYSNGCGVFADGSAKCWGYNYYGQLGNGLTTDSKTPVAVTGLTDAKQLGLGYYTVCARKGDGSAYCWGYNTNGMIGDGTTTNRSTPTLAIASGVASVAPGYYHTCAAMTDGTAKCWGQNTNGEIGNGAGGSSASNVTSPATVSGIDGAGQLSGVAEVCTGYGISCARLSDGRVACWGRNNYGQLGIGSTTPSSANVPKLVGGITAATKLVCGYQHACVIDVDNQVKCWGDGQYGQIGNGGTAVATTAQLATF